MDLHLEPYLPTGRFAVAYSGGGDSTALLHAVRCKDPHVFIVDHALRKDSGLEAKAALNFVKGLGLDADILTWQHGDISTGLQAKARIARYGLIGQACRTIGLTDIITGHTQDDQAETVLMRMDRQTGWRGAAGIARVSPSPLWPQLAGITLWRPMMDYSRADIRDYLGTHKLPFADDPSNENRHYTRIQSRDRLRDDASLRDDMLKLSADMQEGLKAESIRLNAVCSAQVTINAEGMITLIGTIPTRLLTLCLLCVGGQGGPIDTHKIDRLSQSLHSKNNTIATLAGCQIVKNNNQTHILRDPGAVHNRTYKRGLGGIDIARNAVSVLWDGRWWITAHASNITVSPYFGKAASSPKGITAKARLAAAKARPALPVVYQNGDPVSVGVCDIPGVVSVRSAVLPRLHGMLNSKLP